MRTRSLLQIIILVGLLVFFAFTGRAQKCISSKFCSADVFGNYDYRGQSSFAVLSPGDTARASIVVYSKQDARILVCNDPKLGDVEFKIFEPTRVTKRTIKAINKSESEEPIYKLDANGDRVIQVNEYGEPIYNDLEPLYEIERYERIVQVDTVWATERVVKEQLLFHNKASGKNFWEELNVPKTKRLIIEVSVPKNATKVEGCVNIEVGYRAITGKKTFQKVNFEDEK